MSINVRQSAGRCIWRRVFMWSALLLLAFAGCAGTPTKMHTAATSTSQTGTTQSPIPTISPTAWLSVKPYQPNDHDPFQATIIERAPTTTCPPSSRPTVMCWNVTGVGNSIPYGTISFRSFDINYIGPLNDPNGCEPTTRQGTIDIGDATATFTSSGSWCINLVHFVYQVIGGTGRFRLAHGKGSIFIPDPDHNVIEYWTGTLTP